MSKHTGQRAQTARNAMIMTPGKDDIHEQREPEQQMEGVVKKRAIPSEPAKKSRESGER